MNGGHVPKPLLRPGQVGKVKHLMVNLTIDPDAAGPMWWAIVYVPQGTSVGAINVTTSSAATGMYEPNQFVMNCGIADPTAGPIRFGSPIARNLNEGDAIALVVRHTNSAARSVMGTCRYTNSATRSVMGCRYAITLQ